MSDVERETMASIVVLDGRDDPHGVPVTAAVAAALAAPPRGGADAASARPSSAPSSAAEDVMQAADAAVVLDPVSYQSAREAGVPFVAVVFPGVDLAWSGDLAGADVVVVAHEGLADEVVRRGARRAHVRVAGLVAPEGYEPALDLDAAKAEAGLPGGLPLVVVPALAFDEWGLESLLVQLSLVSRDVAFAFDVGTDSELAEELRRVVPVHRLRAWMFAEGTGCKDYWQAADLVVARARGYEVGRALAVGASLVLLPSGRSGVHASDLLEVCGVAEEADVLATLAVALEKALRPEALAAARLAVGHLDVASGASRVAQRVREAWRARHTGRKSLPRGLPRGIERLGSEPGGGEVADTRGGDDGLEARIERELEELKRRV